MLLFAMLAVALCAAVWMTRPLWRAQVSAGQRRRAANVAAYRQRLAELEADHAAGLIDAAAFAGLRQELDARVVLDAEAPEAAATVGARRWALVSLLGVFALLLALGGYYQSGSWRVQQRIASAPAAPAEANTPALDEMLAALEKRLEERPGDVDGWALLGRSRVALQRYGEAVQAFATANTLTGGQRPDLLVDEGEALALSQRNLQGRPRELFDAALALDPQLGKALWYAGLAADEAGDAQGARRHWTQLAQQDLPDSLRAVLNERLGTSSAPNAPAVAAATEANAEAGVVLKLAVRVAPELADKIPGDATLFVFARAQSGPPMPLAVFRGRAAQLPLDVRLDDSMAMTPELRLSQFPAWTVVARITRSGQPQAQSGDLQGSLTVAREGLGKTAMELVIDQAVP